MGAKEVSARVWLDDDGRHVWLRHDCRMGATTDMLPWPEWTATGGVVEPSIACDLCGLHLVGAEVGPCLTT